MEQFASGWKRSYYGKGDVIVYRLNRDGKTESGQSPVFAAKVLMLIYGDAFWPTYTEGDNTGLIATDSIKNFIQREAMNFSGAGLEELCQFLGNKFMGIYPQVEGLQLSAEEIPYQSVFNNASFAPAGPDRAFTCLEINRSGLVEAASGLRGFKLLRLGGSAFRGFVRDEYTTLPEIRNRPLNMWLDMEWSYDQAGKAFTNGGTTAALRKLVFDVFGSFESGSIQEIIYQMGTRALAEQESISEIHLEANNRTWDTIAERGDELGVYTDARPPYGCLGLRLRR